MADIFKTIKAPTEGLFKAKGSKFLAFAHPVYSEESIKDQLFFLQKEYHDARHHCYAWRLGADMKLYRVNDDGEPSGSAGKPIYGQIQARKLTNVLVVVVRYFGGTLLGVGGLIHAYRSAASDALDQAQIIDVKVVDRIKLDFEYAQMNAVMKIIKDLKLDVEDQLFDLNCSLTFKVWKRRTEQVMDQLAKISGCKSSIQE